jgi:hypothetical protein
MPKAITAKPWAARSGPETGWDQITAAAPAMAATMRRYLDQLAVSLRASPVPCIETRLRQVAGLLITTCEVVNVTGITGPTSRPARPGWPAGAAPGRTHPDLDDDH